MVVGKGQSLRIGLKKANAVRRPTAARLVAGRQQHRQAEVGADDLQTTLSRPVVGQGQVAGPGANVENWAVGRRRRQARSTPAPVTVDIETEQVVEQIVARRDVAEHRANARFALVEQ